LSNTERFITIDADNIVEVSFLNQIIELDSGIDPETTVFSWPSINPINGLLYGNGGIKCWPKELVLNMRTHENADPTNLRAQVDFCWDINYVALDTSYSITENNSSPHQAWRAGFREGVKMCLNNGIKVNDLTTLYKGNLNRLITWMMVGADVSNGLWAILGARQGCYMTQFTDWNYINVRDFEYLNNYWNNNVKHLSDKDVIEEIDRLGLIIQKYLPIANVLTSDQSKFFKRFNINPDRQLGSVSLTKTDDRYDIVMITYNEINAEENWKALTDRFPHAKRIDKVDGIHNAHIAAAKLVSTDMFWVVDGDTKVFNNFDFDYIVPTKKKDRVYVWRARNPINELEYGYGGIKLLPTNLTRNMDLSKPDMTTSISPKYKPVFDVASITAFNTDEFSTWRSAFRECCKLSSKIIDRQKNDETNSRLDVWCSVGIDQPFGKYAIDGANAGREYGTKNAGNIDALKLINSFEWLKDRYDKSRN
jgi:hypothetical protein